MRVWQLLKDYVREFEIANQCQFSNEAWQRIKRLESDILATFADERKELVDSYEKRSKQKEFDAAIYLLGALMEVHDNQSVQSGGWIAERDGKVVTLRRVVPDADHAEPERSPLDVIEAERKEQLGIE